MFHFFKEKPLLRDLIPDNHVDIHSHILHGIDDGAKTIEDTISLLQQMKAIGFENIITTPHIITNVYDNTEISIEIKYQETLATIDGNKIIKTFDFAAEYLMDSYLMKKMETQKLLPIKQNYVLVEMSYISPPIQLYDIIFELQLSGYKPILAHPERYQFYHANFNEYEKLKKAGCLFQLNLLSTVGYYNKNVAEIADKLLNKNMIDFVGSDIHHQNHITAFNHKIKIRNNVALENAINQNLLFLK